MKINLKGNFLMFVTGVLLLTSSNIYSAPGDVHARDLDTRIGASLGHIGMEQYGGRIYEMLSSKRTSSWGYRKSGLFSNPLSSIQTSSYWGGRYWRGFDFSKHSWRLHDYILPNAKLMFEIGAKYTRFSKAMHSRGIIYKDRRTGKVVRRVPNPGFYRCDSFVNSIYLTGGVIISSGFLTPSYIYNRMPSQR